MKEYITPEIIIKSFTTKEVLSGSYVTGQNEVPPVFRVEV